MKKIKLVGFIIVLFALQGCSTKETKFCYYQDKRGYIDKDVICGKNIEQAKQARRNYSSIRPHSIKEFDIICIKHKLRTIKGKWPVEIIRHYPKDGVSKVRFRFTKSSLAERIDSRVSTVYLPTVLLHDTLPKIDTVKYIEY
ncbi:hypothetical protein [Labilibaculum sp.]|uniref:hypothetical protein n=1 Tax=Labilibaculum sp. TaxID=2060723 RepID=UPI002AA95EC3|nr:hypothetical protein [Labilibaculum sp.]